MARALAECTNQLGGLNVAVSCRYFRMEIRTPDGVKRFYSLKANSKGTARIEAEEIVREMVDSFNDERIMWRMVGDKIWTFGANSFETRIAKKSFFDKISYYFFGLD